MLKLPQHILLETVSLACNMWWGQVPGSGSYSAKHLWLALPCIRNTVRSKEPERFRYSQRNWSKKGKGISGSVEQLLLIMSLWSRMFPCAASFFSAIYFAALLRCTRQWFPAVTGASRTTSGRRHSWGSFHTGVKRWIRFLGSQLSRARCSARCSRPCFITGEHPFKIQGQLSV